jgi:hypothetical protein
VNDESISTVQSLAKQCQISTINFLSKFKDFKFYPRTKTAYCDKYGWEYNCFNQTMGNKYINHKMVGILVNINFLSHCAPQNDGVVGCIGMRGVSDQQV